MLKKTYVFLVIFMLICICFTPYGISKNDSRVNMPVKTNEFVKLKEDELDIKYPTMTDTFELPNPNDESAKPEVTETPDSFNWKNKDNYDWTTPARHQGSCGSCWAFAALAALEGVIKINENLPDLNPDLSEQYVLSCIDECGSCRGGSSVAALRNLINTSAVGNYCNGIIPESCFPYEEDDSVPCTDKCNNWLESLIPIKDYGYWTPDPNDEDREAIKTELMKKGPLVTHIKATDYFKLWGSINHNPNDYYHDYKKVVGINHVVSLVGWKDDSSINNGGYWICKNSWGKGWGYDGFFNIEYGSLNIDKYLIVWVDYDPDSFYWKPVADTGGPYAALTGENIYFNADESIGYENPITQYQWDFGDGTIGYGKETTHSYTDTGKYTLNLQVKDSEDYTINDTSFVIIQDTNIKPEKPTINGPTDIKLEEKYQYTFEGIDPENNYLYYYIDWGDENDKEWIGPYKSQEPISVNHTWNKINQKQIKAKTKDLFDEESDWATFNIKTSSKEKNIKFFLFEKIINRFPLLRQIFTHISTYLQINNIT